MGEARSIYLRIFFAAKLEWGFCKNFAVEKQASN